MDEQRSAKLHVLIKDAEIGLACYYWMMFWLTYQTCHVGKNLKFCTYHILGWYVP